MIADSTCTCAPDYLERLVAALEPPGTGLVTTLYAGPAGRAALSARLGATQITHTLPARRAAGARARAAGLSGRDHGAAARHAGGGSAGLHALVDHLADDKVLGPPGARASGWRWRLADTVPRRPCRETTLARAVPPRIALGAHHPRAGAGAVRRLGAAIPDLLGVAGRGAGAGGLVELGRVCVAWVVRVVAARGVDRALGRIGRDRACHSAPPIWLLPLRELMSSP